MSTPLTGGRYTKGVVRIGDTVRRPASPKSPFTAELLRLFEERGFDRVPRYLGQDDEGRDILTYLDGWVPARYGRWTDDQVAAVGRLLRAFHDTTRGSHLAGHHDVVCHHDPGPTNFVFRDDLPSALIDFDFAEPGDVLEDLGYASSAWTWCIASKRPPRTPTSTAKSPQSTPTPSPAVDVKQSYPPSSNANSATPTSGPKPPSKSPRNNEANGSPGPTANTPSPQTTAKPSNRR